MHKEEPGVRFLDGVCHPLLEQQRDRLFKYRVHTCQRGAILPAEDDLQPLRRLLADCAMHADPLWPQDLRRAFQPMRWALLGHVDYKGPATERDLQQAKWT